MLTPEELLAQKREIENMKLALEKYQLEIRSIHGKINEITYRQNSGIDISDEQVQRKNVLKRELKSKSAEFKRYYQVSPHRISHRIKDYDHALTQLRMQLDAMENQDRGHRQQTEQKGQQLEPEAARQQSVERSQRLEGLESRGTEIGFRPLTRKAAQEESVPYSCPLSRGRGRKADYDKLYEEPTDAERRQERSSPGDDRDR